MFLAHEMVKIAGIKKHDVVLEPSAGGGNLARAADAAGATVICVELNADLAKKLREKFNTFNNDFLSVISFYAGPFDAVLMCPPRNSIPHIDHAISFLKPNGKLVALVRKDSENIDKYIDNYIPLPYDMFQIDGKHVEAGLIVYGRPI
jgi:protein-L-isoaspartate O-methyltransferase